jgi:hypothetical protein
MRELNETGFQHNRARMNCASILTKILLIDWRWGYKFFYRKLVDSDIFNNTAGWGVLSSTGLGKDIFLITFNLFQDKAVRGRITRLTSIPLTRSCRAKNSIRTANISRSGCLSLPTSRTATSTSGMSRPSAENTQTANTRLPS